MRRKSKTKDIDMTILSRTYTRIHTEYLTEVHNNYVRGIENLTYNPSVTNYYASAIADERNCAFASIKRKKKKDIDKSTLVHLFNNK